MYLLFISIMFIFCSIIFFLTRKKIIFSIISTGLLFISLNVDNLFNINAANIFYICVLTITFALVVFVLIKSPKKLVTPDEMKNHLLMKYETSADFDDNKFFI